MNEQNDETFAYTKDEVQQALNKIANVLKLGAGFSQLIGKAPLPEVINIVIYKTFVAVKFDIPASITKDFDIVHAYAKQLDEVGYVSF